MQAAGRRDGGAASARRPPARSSFIAVQGKDGDLLPGVSGDVPRRRGGQGRRLPRRVRRDLRRAAGRADAGPGRTPASTARTVTYTQEYRGVPVFGSMLQGQRRRRRATSTSVNGYAAPDLTLSVDPRPRPPQVARPRRRLGAQRPAEPRRRRQGRHERHPASRPSLIVYRTGFDQGRARRGRAGLPGRGDQRQEHPRHGVLRRQHRASSLNRYSMVNDALDRELYEQATPPADPVWEEGDPFPGTLNADQQNLVNSAGESYWLFDNAFGRDSYDGVGAHDEDGQQRPRHRLPQRQLERPDDQLLRRGDLRRRRLARVGPRLHRVHLRADLPVPVGCAQRVLLRRLGRDPRPDQRA